jgi:hypothetical protein
MRLPLAALCCCIVACTPLVTTVSAPLPGTTGGDPATTGDATTDASTSTTTTTMPTVATTTTLPDPSTTDPGGPDRSASHVSYA